jgi:hypothetical protein
LSWYFWSGLQDMNLQPLDPGIRGHPRAYRMHCSDEHAYPHDDRRARFGLRRAAWAPGFGVHTERTMNFLGDLTVSCIRKLRMPEKTGINPNTKEP